MTKRTIMCLPPRHSVLLRGRHGIGKSEVVRQCAIELSEKTGRTYEFIDIRLSQREVGDVIGMPKTVAKYPFHRSVYKGGKLVHEETILSDVMIHDLPVWFPRDPNSYGFLFLDEIDRASREVQQSGFELVLDYRLNLNPLPEGWLVISAANADMDVYSVLEMDPALLDRFLVIDFKPTASEWFEHARRIGVHDAIIKYLTKFESDLFTPEKIEPGVVYQSPRSWVHLSNVIKHKIANGDNVLQDLDYLQLLAKGYIGSTTSVSFTEFVRKDYRVLSAKDILDKWNQDMATSLKNAEPTEYTFYSKELVRYISENNIKLTKKQQDNLFHFVTTIPPEAAGGFWADFLKKCEKEATNWYKAAKEHRDYLMKILAKDASLGG
ncbi:MAG: hypothetical protein QW828_05805 [Candidatus Bathyarchaeia archaeon]